MGSGITSRELGDWLEAHPPAVDSGWHGIAERCLQGLEIFGYLRPTQYNAEGWTEYEVPIDV